MNKAKMTRAAVANAHDLACQCRLALAQIYSSCTAVEGIAVFPLLTAAAALETQTKYLSDAIYSDDEAQARSV